MIKPSTNLPFPEIWDNSMRASFVACPSQFYLSYIENFDSAVISIHLHFGKCFAKGCEVFRKTYYDPDGSRDFDWALMKGTEAILEEWGDYEPEFDPETKTLDRCISALEVYFTEHNPATDYIQPYIKQDGTPAVEFSFSIPIPEVLHPTTGLPIIYCGRFDMLGTYQDRLAVIDEKTSKALGQTWRNQFDLRSQFTGYCWAAQKEDYSVIGAFVRGIGLLKTRTTFEEVITMRPQWKIDQWYEQLVYDLRRARDCWINGRWDQDFAEACASYGGCKFKPICDSRAPLSWAPSHFLRRSWDPISGENKLIAPKEGYEDFE